MQSPFKLNDHPLELDRFPVNQVNRDLQAWDAADELAVDYCLAELALSNDDSVLIFNDDFGAIATALYPRPIISVSDSYVSHQGTLANYQTNQLAITRLNVQDCRATLPQGANTVIIKIPKNLSLLEQQLAALAPQLTSDSVIIAAGRIKTLTTAVFKLFERLGKVSTSLAKKKARLLFCQPPFSPIPVPKPQQWQLDGTRFTIFNHANVFARDKLDIGARLMLENLPDCQGKHIIDLGCGNGVLGLMLLHLQANNQLTAVDESYFAVDSARINLTNAFGQEFVESHCQFNVDDCLSNISSSSADIVLCNPPFHQGTAVTDHIAWQMFKDSYRVLKPGGELRIVGNRQLGYHVKLKRLFGNSQLVASNRKFVVLSAIKSL